VISGSVSGIRGPPLDISSGFNNSQDCLLAQLWPVARWPPAVHISGVA